MGIFTKSPAEEKLEELTGGFTLSDGYKAILKANNIDLKTGERIKNQLKEEIKLNIVSEEGLQTRLRYLISQNAKKPAPPKKEVNVPEAPNVNDSHPLKDYENKVTSLKAEYDAKEKVVVNLIEKSFAPPQITYDKFMDSINNCTKVFDTQVDGALNIINLTTKKTPRIDRELNERIRNMNTIISHVDDLTNELIINLSSNKEVDMDVDMLFDDMTHLIDSVKKYE